MFDDEIIMVRERKWMGSQTEKNTHSAMEALDVNSSIVVNVRTFNGSHHNP